MKDNIYYLHFLQNYVSMLQKQQTQIQEESRQVNGALDTLLKAGDVCEYSLYDVLVNCDDSKLFKCVRMLLHYNLCIVHNWQRKTILKQESLVNNHWLLKQAVHTCLRSSRDSKERWNYVIILMIWNGMQRYGDVNMCV